MKSISLTIVMLVFFISLSSAQSKTEGEIVYVQKTNVNEMMKENKNDVETNEQMPTYMIHVLEIKFNGNNALLYSNSKSDDKVIITDENQQVIFHYKNYIDYDKKKLYSQRFFTNGEICFKEKQIKKKILKVLEKTEKINGYNCKVGTANIKDEVYTIYFTTEIKGNYSPIKDVIVDGVILKIESRVDSYTVSTIKFNEVDIKDVSLPKDATIINE